MSDRTVGLDAGNGADTTQAATRTASTTTKQRGSVTSDPQLVACIKITKTLDALDERSRTFVLDYIDAKYNGTGGV